jgi:hypothetical protein
MTLENLVGKGLESEPPSQEEIARLLRKARTRIRDARSEAISMESRFDLAYEGALQLALCALRANGYRPGSRGGHHVIALQSLGKAIGYPKHRIRLLDEFRRQRALGLYDGSFDPTSTEIEALLEVTNELHDSLLDWLQENQPGLLGPDT